MTTAGIARTCALASDALDVVSANLDKASCALGSVGKWKDGYHPRSVVGPYVIKRLDRAEGLLVGIIADMQAQLGRVNRAHVAARSLVKTVEPEPNP